MAAVTTERLLTLALELAGWESVPADSSVGNPGKAINHIFVGLEVGAAELLIARQLGYHAVVACQPVGASGAHWEVYRRHAEFLTQLGMARAQAEGIVAPRVERLRLPGTGRALIIGRTDGGLIASQPVTDDAKDVSEALARMLHVATAALRRAALGPLHRAIVEDRRDAVFTRTDGELIVSLALPRATDPTQGLLDVNRLWSATQHELGLAAGPPAAAPSSTPADTPGAAPTRRIS